MGYVNGGKQPNWGKFDYCSLLQHANITVVNTDIGIIIIIANTVLTELVFIKYC